MYRFTHNISSNVYVIHITVLTAIYTCFILFPIIGTIVVHIVSMPSLWVTFNYYCYSHLNKRSIFSIKAGTSVIVITQLLIALLALLILSVDFIRFQFTGYINEETWKTDLPVLLIYIVDIPVLVYQLHRMFRPKAFAYEFRIRLVAVELFIISISYVILSFFMVLLCRDMVRMYFIYFVYDVKEMPTLSDITFNPYLTGVYGRMNTIMKLYPSKNVHLHEFFGAQDTYFSAIVGFMICPSVLLINLGSMHNVIRVMHNIHKKAAKDLKRKNLEKKINN